MRNICSCSFYIVVVDVVDDDVFVLVQKPSIKSLVKIGPVMDEMFLDSMISLEGDKMTALWPIDSLTLTFYVPFSNSIPNWTTFVNEVLWFNG